MFTLVEGIIDPNKNGANSGSSEDLVGDEEGEKSVASAEDQLHKEMTVYEVYDALDVSWHAIKFHCNKYSVSKELC